MLVVIALFGEEPPRASSLLNEFTNVEWKRRFCKEWELRDLGEFGMEVDFEFVFAKFAFLAFPCAFKS